jgi:hypothetical protein
MQTTSYTPLDELEECSHLSIVRSFQ